MTRIPRLATAAALAVTAASVGAQEPRPGQPIDSIDDVGRREGRAAGETRGVNDRLALGLTTGFIAGLFGPAVLGEPLIGVVAIAPVVWTLHAAGENRATLPPALAQSIQERPPAYQQAYRAGYRQRVAERRMRAARTGAVAGGVLGVATLAALIVHVLRNAGG